MTRHGRRRGARDRRRRREAVASTDSVATPEGGKAIIDTALEHYGRIDILVHNAGNVRRASLKEMTYDDFEAVVDVHLRGAFHVVRPAFPRDVRRRLRPHRADVVDRRAVRQPRGGELRRRQGGRDRAVQRRGDGRCRARREEQRHRARRGDENGRGHRHVGLPADGTGAGGTRRRLAGARILFRHWGDARRARGRVARAVVAETPGVYRPSWSIADVGDHIAAIRDASEPVVFPVVPDGHGDHIRYSFAMAGSRAESGSRSCLAARWRACASSTSPRW